MSYLYYPGCSLKSTGRAYEESMLAVFAALGSPLQELEDWNCCGATAYMAQSELKAFALCARNFALAERQSSDPAGVDLVVPCAACYLGLNKAKRYLAEHPGIFARVNTALQAAGMEYTNRVRIRHPLDVLVNDIGTDRIAAHVVAPLTGTRVACYYGCQLVRPYADFDSADNPVTMDTLLEAAGAEVADWPLKTRCCGGSLTGTVQDVGLRLSYILLAEAMRHGFDTVATACPLCQFNLECYQSKMNKRYTHHVSISTVFFTQLLGQAMGIAPNRLGIPRLFPKPSRRVQPEPVTGGTYA